MAIDASVETTVLTVHHLVKPETQDILLQNILHFLFHHRNLVHIIS